MSADELERNRKSKLLFDKTLRKSKSSPSIVYIQTNQKSSFSIAENKNPSSYLQSGQRESKLVVLNNPTFPLPSKTYPTQKGKENTLFSDPKSKPQAFLQNDCFAQHKSIAIQNFMN